MPVISSSASAFVIAVTMSFSSSLVLTILRAKVVTAAPLSETSVNVEPEALPAKLCFSALIDGLLGNFLADFNEAEIGH